MTKPKHPPAPPEMSPEARALWRRIVAEFEFDAGEREVLEALCRAYQRQREAQAILDRDGIVMTTRFGEVRAHPAVAIARDSATLLARLVSQLKLESADGLVAVHGAGTGRPVTTRRPK